MENKSLVAEITKKFNERFKSKKWFEKPAIKQEKLRYFIENEVSKYVRNRIDQFHRHSLHFGMYAIQG